MIIILFEQIIEQNTLQIFNLSLVDAGEYECVARSSVNEISSRSNVLGKRIDVTYGFALIGSDGLFLLKNDFSSWSTRRTGWCKSD